jgi:KDO2-lipid IV(A) lauroyltransferase
MPRVARSRPPAVPEPEPAASRREARRFRHLLAVPGFYRLGFAAGKRIPPAILYRVADVIAAASHLTCRRQVAGVRGNLARLLPDAPARERKRLSWRIYRNYARYLVDYGRFRFAEAEGLESALAGLDGGEHLHRAFEMGRGVILVTGHVGNWELGGTFFGHRGVTVNVVTLPDGSREIDALRGRYREDYAVRTIVLDGSPFAPLEMMAALKRREVVAMLVDRWEGPDAVPAPFLGGVQRLPRGPFALSRATGAPVLPGFVVKDGRDYRGVVEPPFVVEQDDLTGYAARVSRALERILRRYPDQWYNFEPLGDPGSGLGGRPKTAITGSRQWAAGRAGRTGEAPRGERGELHRSIASSL